MIHMTFLLETESPVHNQQILLRILSRLPRKYLVSCTVMVVMMHLDSRNIKPLMKDLIAGVLRYRSPSPRPSEKLPFFFHSSH